ncbi:hypothetical protein Tc00.1047053507747.94 [Trypanosoma cruzi]|uniref:Secreted protein n=1 Tax=Trypanosoma cruzi (strain CL Brener) TaxID=353153 RepID=Q4DVI3_TRYCC|nr:hypothetical protein Tc00.1047053507747.94 [Trypanosoma cruzi]EAN96537.1 hypothetical protein Tc00.1047053507747.94 [Trypanosoma cruzi]|eukprot:XP_818388.1 hypothetical protein [Trypanosoma cruzi strain CL Brener]
MAMRMTGRVLLVCPLRAVVAIAVRVSISSRGGVLSCGGSARWMAAEGQEEGQMRPPWRNACVIGWPSSLEALRDCCCC